MTERERIKLYLVDKDNRLKAVISSCQYPRSRKNSDIYLALVSSIVSQQLSIKAADAIYNRFLDLFVDRYPDPEEVVKARLQRLQKAGLSRQKSNYIKNVATFALQNDGLEYRRLNRLSDEELVNHLTQIKGVGRWTVEMLLMFAMDRKDVFSCDDLGIQQAMQRLYRIEDSGRELKSRMYAIAENWRPYRSIVCKYLWQWKAIKNQA
jgi:DNA-3-methyladenine glycosylase II